MEQRVWIAQGCTRCGWCRNLSPEIFTLTDQGMVISSESRCDQLQSHNRDEQSPLTSAAWTP